MKQIPSADLVNTVKGEKVENEQLTSTPAASAAETSKEASDDVKSKPLSLNQEVSPDKQEDSPVKQKDSSDKQVDATSTKQESLQEGKPPPTTQIGGTVSSDAVAAPTLERDVKDVSSDTKPTGTSGDAEPKVESALKQENENQDVRTTPTELTVDAGKHTAESAATGIAEVQVASPPPTLATKSAESATTGTIADVASRPHPIVHEESVHESTQEQEVITVESEVPTTMIEEGLAVLPSAPALIDFCTEEHQVLGIEAVNIIPEAADVSTTAEVSQEASGILYPRLDSIMRGLYIILYWCSLCKQALSKWCFRRLAKALALHVSMYSILIREHGSAHTGRRWPVGLNHLSAFSPPLLLS